MGISQIRLMNRKFNGIQTVSSSRILMVEPRVDVQEKYFLPTDCSNIFGYKFNNVLTGKHIKDFV